MIHATLLTMLLFGSPLWGGVVFDIEIDPPSPAPSTTIVTVFARKMAAADPDFIMTGGNLAIDLGNDGFGIPAGFSILSATSPAFSFAEAATGVAQTLAATGQNPNFDAVVNLSAGPLNINSTSNTVLFELEIGIDASVQPGTIAELSFVENPIPGAYFSVAPAEVDGMPVQVRTNSGSVSVVPEPSSLWLMTLVGLACLVGRKLRNRYEVDRHEAAL